MVSAVHGTRCPLKPKALDRRSGLLKEMKIPWKSLQSNTAS